MENVESTPYRVEIELRPRFHFHTSPGHLRTVGHIAARLVRRFSRRGCFSYFLGRERIGRRRGGALLCRSRLGFA